MSCNAMLFGDPDEGDHVCTLAADHDGNLHQCDCGEVFACPKNQSAGTGGGN